MFASSGEKAERNANVEIENAIEYKGENGIRLDVMCDGIYALDVVISVGYRVKSMEGTRFR